jgi:hypothetical protein
MKTWKRIALLWSFLAWSAYSFSQQSGAFKFSEESHDFGQIKEENGPVNVEFKFVNTGNAPLIIKNVKASCGCTTPSYSQEPVQPGKSGYIKAQYDPFNRPGVFEKNLTIEANTDPSFTFLKIKGFVIAKPRTIADDFPDTIGNLRFTSRFLNMGAINTKQPSTAEFKIYNEGKNAIQLNPIKVLPKHLKIEIQPNLLQSKQIATIKVTYDAKLKNDFGYLFDNFILNTNDKLNPVKELSVVAIVSEDFSHLTTEQKENVPKITLSTDQIEFGEIQAGDKKEIRFEISNTGKSDLDIRKIKSTCKCITISEEKVIVKPNEKHTLIAYFDTTDRKGKEYKSIYIYSNDYTKSEAVINIKATVIKP